MTINEIIKYSGLSKAAFARLYKIPLRTLEDWAAGRKLPRSDYIFYLLERVVKYDRMNSYAVAETDLQIALNGAESTEDEIINNRFL